jgi:2-keto-4-pentenoate hydratase
MSHDEETLNEDEREGYAHWILGKRETESFVDDPEQLPPLGGMSDVYDVHDHMTKIMNSLGSHAGWKCGACAPAPQKSFGLNEPFRAPLFANIVQQSGSTFSNAGVTIIEAEFAFVMGKPLEPKSSGEE